MFLPLKFCMHSSNLKQQTFFVDACLFISLILNIQKIQDSDKILDLLMVGSIIFLGKNRSIFSELEFLLFQINVLPYYQKYQILYSFAKKYPIVSFLKTLITDIFNDKNFILKQIFVLFFFIIVCNKFIYKNQNLCRKYIHFILFTILISCKPYTIYLCDLASFILSFISLNFKSINYLLLKIFLRKKNPNGYILEHIMLIKSLLTPANICTKRNFIMNLIVISIQDSIASIAGIFFNKKKKKSFLGTFFGIIGSILFHYYFLNEFFAFFYITTGFVERFVSFNDNYVLSLFCFAIFMYNK